MPVEQFLSPDTLMLIGVVDSVRTLLLIFLVFSFVILIVGHNEKELVKISLKLMILISILYLLVPSKGTMISCLVLKTYPPNSWILPEIVSQLLGVL